MTAGGFNLKISPKMPTKPPSSKARRVFRRDGDRCLKCGSEDDLTLDHVLPRSKGGSNSEKNLQTLCGRCNREKGATFVDYRKNGRPETPFPPKPPRRGMWGLHDAIMKALPETVVRMVIIFDGERYSATVFFSSGYATTPYVAYHSLKECVLALVRRQTQK